MLSGKFDPEHAEGLQKPGRGQAPDIDRLEASIGSPGLTHEKPKVFV
jgi:hypothetical protein